MLEMIREFALAQMSNQERTATEQRHIAYFMAQPATNLATIAHDHANFRTALASAITAGDTHAALTLCRKLSWLWEMHGLFREGMTLARAALAMPVGEDARACGGRYCSVCQPWPGRFTNSTLLCSMPNNSAPWPTVSGGRKNGRFHALCWAESLSNKVTTVAPKGRYRLVCTLLFRFHTATILAARWHS